MLRLADHGGWVPGGQTHGSIGCTPYCCAACGVRATSLAHAEVLIGSAYMITGKMAWFGEQHQRAIATAVAEINPNPRIG
jgi:ABC-type branched-subunit amino acid transport system substrate-binding protein